MKRKIISLLSFIVALFMCTCIIHTCVLPARAEEEKEDIQLPSPPTFPIDIEEESTWHIYEEKSLSELVQEDDIKLLRREAVNRTKEITFTVSSLPSVNEAVSYFWNNAAFVQTGKPKEGDYLYWQTDGATASISDHVFTGYQIYTFTPEYYTDAEQEAAVDDAVNDLIDELGIRYKTDYLKVKAVYDWIVGNIRLLEASEDDNLSKTAYSALIEKTADSQGFAVLFYRMMMELGMDTRVIRGKTPEDAPWFWNIVKIGDVYYYTDLAMAKYSGNSEGWFLNGAEDFIGHTADAYYRTLQFTVEYEGALTSYVPQEDDLVTEDVCQGVFLDTRAIRIDENQTYQMKAQVLPEPSVKPVFWSSSDESVVTVDASGLLTGISEGTAYVYASVGEGAKAARCKVTVEKVYPDSGMAYAVLVATDEVTRWGDLVFLRSKNNYEPSTYDEVVDIWGNTYKGVVLAKGATIEGSRCSYNITLRPWSDYNAAILRIYVADRQIIHPQVLNGWFYNLSRLEEFYGAGFDLSCCSAANQMFGDCSSLEKVDFRGMYTPGLKGFSSWFNNCYSLKELDFTPLDTSSLQSMWKMLELCTGLTKLDISTFDTSGVKSMSRAFFGCRSLEEVKLGPGFTNWIDDAYLPAGLWTNGEITKTETELYEEYPLHAAEWAGTWTKVHDDIPVTDVVLNKSELILEEGESERLSVTISPEDATDRTIKWSSTNESVATVDQDGIVTAVKEGTAVIEAWSESAQIGSLCQVIVKKKTIRVEGITMLSPDYTICSFETVQLVAEIIPLNAADRSVTWSSSNPDIAAVNDDGLVMGKKPGVALITAKTNDGGYTCTCTITVSGMLPGFVEITLNKNKAELATGSSLQLKAQIEPLWTDQSVTWTSTDPAIVSVDSNGKVTANRYGTAVVSATSVEDTGAMATCLIQTRFYDVNDSSQYYYKPVYWAADNNITGGYDGVYFGPQRDCTRRELCIFLWRLSNKPAVSGTLPYTDTAKYSTSSDTYKAILWCYKNGIVKGYNDNTFRPDNSVTRKDTMIMLYRLNGKPNVAGTMNFTDCKGKYNKQSDTYKAIIWGTQKGITKGYSDGTFRPDDKCLREHIVTFIYRYDQKFN